MSHDLHHYAGDPDPLIRLGAELSVYHDAATKRVPSAGELEALTRSVRGILAEIDAAEAGSVLEDRREGAATLRRFAETTLALLAKDAETRAADPLVRLEAELLRCSRLASGEEGDIRGDGIDALAREVQGYLDEIDAAEAAPAVSHLPDRTQTADRLRRLARSILADLDGYG